MSDDSASNSEVASKYFSDQPGMDESLSEFQQKKKSYKGPKDLKKPQTSTRKPKKHIRGQKDIRTALRPKKNELVTYTNDFDKVCKESGIDVDPEHLQLAIALSKSLQNTTDFHKPSSSNTKDKSVKIRKTLQEYGFKVPILKSIINTKKKVNKRYRKDYKLILTTREEKQQIISDKYTQILFQQIESKTLTTKFQNIELKYNLYNIATHIPYQIIRDNNLFYIDGLVKANAYKLGYCLRNWSQIPGRTASPEPEGSDVKFSEFECAQDELDVILSGTVNSAQELVKTLDKVHIDEEVNKETKISQENKMDSENIFDHDDVSNDGLKVESWDIGNSYKSSKTFHIEEPVIATQARACSPDIFDDEVSTILGKTEEKIFTSQELPKNVTNISNIVMDLTECVAKTKENSIFNSQELRRNVTDSSNIVMDLTKCVAVNSQRNVTLQCRKITPMSSQLSQGNNLTKRKSNDFMEITDCVAGSSQHILENIVKDIDLTQDSDDKFSAENCGTDDDKSENLGTRKATECVDLTQAPDKSEEDIQSLDLTQSSNSGDELPMVQISGKVTTNNVSQDNTFFFNNNEYRDMKAAETSVLQVIEDGMKYSEAKHVTETCFSSVDNASVLKAKQSLSKENTVQGVKDFPRNNTVLESALPVRLECCRKSKSDSFFDEFVYSHSDKDKQEHSRKIAEHEGSITENNQEQINMELNDKNPFDSERCIDIKVNEDIDLTQALDSDSETDLDLEYGGSEIPNITKSRNILDVNNIINEVYQAESSDSSYDNREICTADDEMTEDPQTSKCVEMQDGNDINNVNNDIDLTQSSNSDKEQTPSNNNSTSSQQVSYESLGKKDNVSIDYDEVFDDIIQRHSIDSKQSSTSSTSALDYMIESSKSITDNDYERATKCTDREASQSKKLERTNSIISNTSQNSEVFEISDSELNYSINQSKYKSPEDNFDFGGISVMDNLSNARSSKSTRLSEDERRSENARTSKSTKIIEDASPNTYRRISVDERNKSTRTTDETRGRKSRSHEDIANYCSINPIDAHNMKYTNQSIDDSFLMKYTNQTMGDSFLPLVEIGSKVKPNPRHTLKDNSLVTEPNFEHQTTTKEFTPFKLPAKENISTETPSSSQYVIKTDQVTPMLDYESMTTPERNKQLDKYGLKPFKRKRAIQLLTHLYNQTHPILGECLEDQPSPSKKRKQNCSPQKSPSKVTKEKSPKKATTQKSPRKPTTQDSPRKIATQKSQRKNASQKSPRKKLPTSPYKSAKNINSVAENIQLVDEKKLYETTNDCPVLKNLTCSEEDWVFQKKEKAKLHSCRVPLHIAFHNYISARPNLREAILRYEPVNIDDIHKGLVQNGLKFDPKDLLKFLDKKCITVKTADNTSSNNKKQS